MLEKVRIGFVDTGGIAAHHMGNLKKLEAVQFAAMCDVWRRGQPNRLRSTTALPSPTTAACWTRWRWTPSTRPLQAAQQFLAGRDIAPICADRWGGSPVTTITGGGCTRNRAGSFWK